MGGIHVYIRTCVCVHVMYWQIPQMHTLVHKETYSKVGAGSLDLLWNSTYAATY